MDNNSKELTPEQIVQQQKEKMEILSKALGLDRMNEDTAELRKEIQSVSSNLEKLCTALGNAQQQNQQQSQTQSSDEIPPEQKMLLLKDGIAGVADLVKAWKGTTLPPQIAQQNDFQTMIMQSFAKMIQAKVDETIFSTLPPEMTQQFNQFQAAQRLIQQPQQPQATKPSFEK